MKYRHLKHTGGNEHQPEVSKLLILEFLPKAFLVRGTTNTQPARP